MANAKRDKPLAGIRVIDLSRLLPGALCTTHLADMGADVIKVEDTGVGDYSRWIEPKKTLHSAFYLTVGRNKRAIKLDLKKPAGKEVFLALAKGADVIFESFRPGVVDRLGIGYEAIKALNARIVYCALSGYGQDGPYRLRAGHDVNYCAYAGVADQIGVKGGPPAVPNFQIADLAGGTLSCAMGILAALVDAQRSGRGRYVDVAMTDCTLAHAVITLARIEALGQTRARGDDYISGGLPCYGIYETKDARHMSLGALEDKFWHAFCEGVGRPDLADKGRSWDEAGDVVQAEVAAIFEGEPQAHWIAFAERVDCCLAPVLDMAESFENEQLIARGMFAGYDHPTDGPVRQFAFPIKFSDFTFTIDRHAPLHGEHTDEILDSLGYDAAAIAALKADGVI